MRRFEPRCFLTSLWLAAAAANLPAAALADEISYVSNEELAAEIARRKEDIARTRLRVSTLAARLEEAKEAARRARVREREIEKTIASKMRVFYKLTHRGGSLRLLLGSKTPTELLFRLRLLEHLLLDGLQARRRAGLRVAETAEMVRQLSKDYSSAGRMLEMLDKTLLDLLRERNRRARS